MTQNSPIILSASRRTDIPAFYLDWFLEHIRQGSFDVKNPYTKQSKTIVVSPLLVHSIVFWSKNYAPFIESGTSKKLRDLGYHLFFNFTINSTSKQLEPFVPPLSSRIAQLKQLALEFGPDRIAWRFDPVCWFQTGIPEKFNDNLSDFETIAKAAADLGIKKCVTSFFDPYKKIDQRLNRLSKKGCVTRFIDPAIEQKIHLILQMEQQLCALGMDLSLCCEHEIFNHLPLQSRVVENACIDGPVLKQLFGKNLAVKRDYGQRSKKGCQCAKAVDIGSYDDHPCFHNCLFCYANPVMDNPEKLKQQ